MSQSLVAIASPAARAARATGLPPIPLDEVLRVRPHEARQRLREAGYYPARLTGENYKLAKEVAGADVEIAGVCLAPHALSGVGRTLCAFSVPSCRANCLGTEAGWNAARRDATMRPKLARAQALGRDPVAFAAVLLREVELWAARVRAADAVPALRLNVYSDVPWEVLAPDLVARLARAVRLYDYTKIPGRRRAAAELGYDLTLSWSGPHGAGVARRELEDGGRVAVVLMTPGRPDSGHQTPLPSALDGFLVVDGDRHDARFLDPGGVMVGLRFKRQAERQAAAAAAPAFALAGPWSDWGYESDGETGLLGCGSPCSIRATCATCWPARAAL